jgi:RHS repeat-associated protein
VQSGTTNTVIGNVFLPKTPELFLYDADGNLISDGRWTNSWDAENRLITMQGISTLPTAARKKLDFEYDWRGRRVRKTVSNWSGSAFVAASTNRFVYDGWNLMVEANPANVTQRRYIWGLDLSGSEQGAGGVGGLLAIQDVAGSNGVNFAAYDLNGNIAALVNATNGTVSATYEYGPFGEALRVTGSASTNNPIRFSTKYTDIESDMLYYGYRYYNPNTGRWLSRDPIGDPGLAISTPRRATFQQGQRQNLYLFAGNNALTIVDWLGLCCTPENCVRKAACAVMAVPQGNNPIQAESLPELVELAEKTEKFGLFFESGMTGAASVLSLGESVAAGVGGSLNTLSTSGGGALARTAAGLFNSTANTRGWTVWTRLDYQQCQERAGLSPARLFGSDHYFDDVHGEWTQYIGSPDLSDLLLGTWNDYASAMNSGVEGSKKAIKEFGKTHKNCK